MIRMATTSVRPLERSEIDAIARIWHDGWQEAHAALLPAALAKHRTLDTFAPRLERALDAVRVVGPIGAPLGFCMVRQDELHQLYVAAEARGTGVAAALVTDAEQRLAAAGVSTAWLACAIGNERAARFYEKCGWCRAGNMVSESETPEGNIGVEVWRYERELAGAR